MFGFAWSEFAVIAVVALIAIGPKDMPVAIRAITGALKKARRMAAEFQTHVDDMVREANLQEVRDQISELRNFDVKSMVEQTVDPDHSLRDTFATNPLDPVIPPAADTSAEPRINGELALAEPERPDEALTAPEPAETPKPATPAFIPPGIVTSPAEAEAAEAPAFIPPSVAAMVRSRVSL
jgi:sec-independent protein translocase protein TatB